MSDQITNSLREELLRKLIHLLSLVVPVAYLFFSKQIILALIALGLSIAIWVEWKRQRDNKFSRLFYKWLGPLLRESERTRLTASTLLIIGCFISVLIFPKMIAIFSLFTLIISDAAAALIGRRFGRFKLYAEKTWEGTLTFFGCTFLISVFTLKFSLIYLILISSLVTLVELFSENKYDNLILPITAAALVWLIQLF